MALCGGSKKPIQRKIVILGDGACGKTSLLNVFTRGYFPQVYEPTVFENYVHDIFVDGVPIQLSLWDTAGQEEFDRLRSLSYSDTHTIMLCFSVDSRDSLENVASKWVGEITDHCEGVKLVLVALKCDLRSQTEEQAVVKPRNTPSDTNGTGIEKSNTNTNNNNISTQSTDSTLTNGGVGSNTGALNGITNGSTNNRALHAQSIVSEPAKKYITYEEGLAMAKRIGALRYLECSAKKNRGVNECFTEAARCALSAKPKGAAQDESDQKSSSCIIS